MATKIGSEFAVNSTTTGKQVPGGVTVVSNGNMVVGWYDTSGVGADTSVSALRAQIFDGDGDEVGGEFQLNTSASGEQVHERVTALGDGRFVLHDQDAVTRHGAHSKRSSAGPPTPGTDPGGPAPPAKARHLMAGNADFPIAAAVSL